MFSAVNGVECFSQNVAMFLISIADNLKKLFFIDVGKHGAIVSKYPKVIWQKATLPCLFPWWI